MNEEEINFKDSNAQKRMILRLRWVTIIVTSYLVLFSRGISSPETAPLLLILGYLSSNLVAYFIPPPYFLKLSFFYFVLLFDTLMISFGIYFTARFESDFYLAYFLIILFASIARNFKLLLVNTLVICGVYGWILWAKGLDMKALEEGILLRIPFIFVVNLFYGFLIQTFEKRTRQIKMELKELEESEKRYRQIVESSHDAVAILDENDRIKFFNKRLVQLTQYSAEELTGMDLGRIMKEQDLEAFIKELVSNSNVDGSLVRETEVLSKEGESRKAEVSASLFSMPSGQTFTILYLKDVTEKKQLEERMVQSEKLRALGELAAGVAHDLNNVLGAILGRAQLIRLSLREKPQGAQKISEETLQRELRIIERAALDGSQTIKKIQEFSRANPEGVYFVPINANEMVEEIIELMKPKIKDESEEKGIS
ncbi:MAG: PAS domain S-box protein, partial [Thermodesulfobacteriota bacterium]